MHDYLIFIWFFYTVSFRKAGIPLLYFCTSAPPWKSIKFIRFVQHIFLEFYILFNYNDGRLLINNDIQSKFSTKKFGMWIYNLRRSLLSLLIFLDIDCIEVLLHVFYTVFRYVTIFMWSYVPNTLINIQCLYLYYTHAHTCSELCKIFI